MIRRELEDLIESLANTPAEVRRLADGLTVNDSRWKPDGGEFSVLENVCHLRDLEVDGYTVRIKRILVEDQPILADIDGDKLAAERDYNNQELTSAMEGFAKAREDNLTLIRGLSAGQLARGGTLENIGTINLERLLELMLEHDSVHLDDLAILHARLAQTA